MSSSKNLREISHSQKSSEWGTPPEVLRLVRTVFGGEIDLDPASSEEFNKNVMANRFFTEEKDGLSRSWKASNVFLNAPGGPVGVSGQTIWGNKLLTEYELGHFEQGIQLIFRVSTETRFMQHRLGHYPICFPKGRIKFIPADGMYEDTSKNQPTHANALLYIGPYYAKFHTVFSELGIVVPPWMSKKATST